ncbi:hypothetical protein Cni_G09890 [Canna indica]|uniref:Uncharacterized protein n=1 Tax=Canna indica TaxID=4628 RepID=A0AAQ3Q6V8_9LILI|nr:hypothetical protein Cni_G09890 [Canna indica]
MALGVLRATVEEEGDAKRTMKSTTSIETYEKPVINPLVWNDDERMKAKLMAWAKAVVPKAMRSLHQLQSDVS